MMRENVENFIEGLLDKTKAGELDWMPFSTFKDKREISREFENGRANSGYSPESVREPNSYYLKSGDGFVFLFEVCHGDPDVISPAMDTIELMVKINSVLPLDNLSNYGGEEGQEMLERLKLLVENYLEEKYRYPDALCEFMGTVLSKSNTPQ